jgi:hypothetical protein
VSAIFNTLRVLLVGLVLSVFAPVAFATGTNTLPRSANGTTSAEPLPVEKPRAGSPEMGVLIILGAVGFLVFVAWVFSRVGDESTGGDRSLV